MFPADGKRFLLLDSDGFLHEFSFPACAPLATVVESRLREEPWGEGDIESLAYSGAYFLVNLGGDLLVLRSGDLAHSPLPVGRGFEVLENGMLLRRQAGHGDIHEFHVEGSPFPVVAALDAKSSRATGVFRKTRSRWQDLTAQVGWLQTNFTVARE
jgi:hypothetical protein